MRRSLVWKLSSLFKSLSIGLFCIFLFTLISIGVNKEASAYQLLIKDSFPLYNASLQLNALYKLFTDDYTAKDIVIVTPGIQQYETVPVFADSQAIGARLPQKIDTTAEMDEPLIIGLDNVIYQPETDIDQPHQAAKETLTKENRDKLKNFDYLKQQLYTIDKRTALVPEDIDIDAYLGMDFSVSPGSGPKVLIFHTHSQEAFKNSRPGVADDTITGVGAELANLLTNKYGIETIHHTGTYDIVNGQTQISGAYERMEPAILKILAENPSIEVIIDMHRDGVRDDVHLVTEINGQPTAQIMFFNGISRTYTNGVLAEIDYLPNPYIKENLALSLNLQLTANQHYPALTRKIYINAFRYSLHMKAKTIFVEVGAQTNTVEEAKNAMQPLAEVIYDNIK